MIKVVNERHDREWAQYLKDSNEARKELAEIERSIKGAFNTDGQLSEGMQKEIDHMRNAHLEEWGINGRRAMEIINQQHQEEQEELRQFLQCDDEGETFTNEEMEEMYAAFLASKQEDRQYVPDAPNQQAINEVVDSNKETTTQNTDQNQSAGEFKERLQAMRQQQQSNKPKLH